MERRGSEAENDAACIRRSLGDPAAFGLIFSRHGEAVHRYLARRAEGSAVDDMTALHSARKALMSSRASSPTSPSIDSSSIVTSMRVMPAPSCSRMGSTKSPTRPTSVIMHLRIHRFAAGPQ
jgi:hypothetical protein